MPERKLVKDGYPDTEPGDYGSFVRIVGQVAAGAEPVAEDGQDLPGGRGEGFGAYLARTKGPG